MSSQTSQLKKSLSSPIENAKHPDKKTHFALRALYQTFRKIFAGVAGFLWEGLFTDLFMLKNERTIKNIIILIASGVALYIITNKLKERRIFVYVAFWKFAIKFFLLQFMNPEMVF